MSGFRTRVWSGWGQAGFKAGLRVWVGLSQGPTISLEMLSPTSRQADKERHKWDVEKGQQELYEALAKGLQGLQKTLYDNEEVQRAHTTCCLQLLAQEIRDRWVLPGGREGREGRPGRGNHRWDGGNGKGLSKGVWGALEVLGDKRRGWGRQEAVGGVGDWEARNRGDRRWDGKGGWRIRKLVGVAWEAGG